MNWRYNVLTMPDVKMCTNTTQLLLSPTERKLRMKLVLTAAFALLRLASPSSTVASDSHKQRQEHGFSSASIGCSSLAPPLAKRLLAWAACEHMVFTSTIALVFTCVFSCITSFFCADNTVLKLLSSLVRLRSRSSSSTWMQTHLLSTNCSSD